MLYKPLKNGILWPVLFSTSFCGFYYYIWWCSKSNDTVSHEGRADKANLDQPGGPIGAFPVELQMNYNRTGGDLPANIPKGVITSQNPESSDRSSNGQRRASEIQCIDSQFANFDTTGGSQEVMNQDPLFLVNSHTTENTPVESDEASSDSSDAECGILTQPVEAPPTFVNGNGAPKDRDGYRIPASNEEVHSFDSISSKDRHSLSKRPANLVKSATDESGTNSDDISEESHITNSCSKIKAQESVSKDKLNSNIEGSSQTKENNLNNGEETLMIDPTTETFGSLNELTSKYTHTEPVASNTVNKSDSPLISPEKNQTSTRRKPLGSQTYDPVSDDVSVPGSESDASPRPQSSQSCTNSTRETSEEHKLCDPVSATTASRQSEHKLLHRSKNADSLLDDLARRESLSKIPLGSKGTETFFVSPSSHNSKTETPTRHTDTYTSTVDTSRQNNTSATPIPPETSHPNSKDDADQYTESRKYTELTTGYPPLKSPLASLPTRLMASGVLNGEYLKTYIQASCDKVINFSTSLLCGIDQLNADGHISINGKLEKLPRASRDIVPEKYTIPNGWLVTGKVRPMANHTDSYIVDDLRQDYKKDIEEMKDLLNKFVNSGRLGVSKHIDIFQSRVATLEKYLSPTLERFKDSFQTQYNEKITDFKRKSEHGILSHDQTIGSTISLFTPSIKPQPIPHTVEEINLKLITALRKQCGDILICLHFLLVFLEYIDSNTTVPIDSNNNPTSFSEYHLGVPTSTAQIGSPNQPRGAELSTDTTLPLDENQIRLLATQLVEKLSEHYKRTFTVSTSRYGLPK